MNKVKKFRSNKKNILKQVNFASSVCFSQVNQNLNLPITLKISDMMIILACV